MKLLSYLHTARKGLLSIIARWLMREDTDTTNEAGKVPVSHFSPLTSQFVRGWIHDIEEKPLGCPWAFEWDASTNELRDFGMDHQYGLPGHTWEDRQPLDFPRVFKDGRRRLLGLIRCGLDVEVLGLAGYLTAEILQNQFPASAHAPGALAPGSVLGGTGPADQPSGIENSEVRSEKGGTPKEKWKVVQQIWGGKRGRLVWSDKREEFGSLVRSGPLAPVWVGCLATDLETPLFFSSAAIKDGEFVRTLTGAFIPTMDERQIFYADAEVMKEAAERYLERWCVANFSHLSPHHVLGASDLRMALQNVWTLTDSRMAEMLDGALGAIAEPKTVLTMWCALRDAVREFLGNGYADSLVPVQCERACDCLAGKETEI